MDIKDELGKKIRRLREEQKISRESFCGDESELTVRQLSRIEGGQSLPTLPKLTFISKRLSVSLHTLIDEEKFELPKQYLLLKQKMYKIQTYGLAEKIKEKEDYLTAIYETYYDSLPEEEQLAIDVIQAGMDVNESENLAFGEGILEEYFSQILMKSSYSTNELLIIELYIISAHAMPLDEKLIAKLLNNLIAQVDYSIEFDLFILRKVLKLGIGLMRLNHRYLEMKPIIDVLNTIMIEKNDFHNKPLLILDEGTYYLFGKLDVSAAKEKYEKAALLAELHENIFLRDKIREEWERNLSRFNSEYQ